MNTSPDPVPDSPRIGGRIALLAIAGAQLIIFLTLFVVGLALGNHDASATALLTVAPQTPSPKATDTPHSGGGKGKPTATPLPTTPPTPTYTPIPPTPSPTLCFGCG